MPRLAFPLLLLAGLMAALASTRAEPDAKTWKLVWSDEFDGKELDRKKWDHELGNGFFDYDSNQWISGWGNDELQYYTREPENCYLQDGSLHLRAVKESYQGCGYTSAKVKTRKRDGTPLFDQKYGRFEFRAKLPTGRGVWPAIWMLPREEQYGTWASSGEIDILEARGQEPNKVLGTLHYGSRWPANTSSGGEFIFPDKQDFTDWHVYALEWEPGEIRWYVDEKLYSTKSFWWSTSKLDGKKGATPKAEDDLNPWPAPFDRPFYLILNLAVGGRFLGPPDAKTVFPAEMLVDYVRVYEKVGGYGEAKPRGKGKLPFEK